jgi:hypothetical protein
MAQGDPPSREALQRADKLVALGEHPSFSVLVEEAVRKAERNEKSLVARAKSKEGEPHAEWRYWAGFEAGMEYLLNLPEAAQKTLDKVNNPAGREQ